MRVLITGHEGLIGRALRRALDDAGHQTVGLDLRAANAERGDVRREDDVRGALAGCDGVVHLGACSRVIDGERDPDGCWSTNVGGTATLLAAAPRWLVYASSREVYGQPATLPAGEDCPRAPINVYGRSKAAAEDLCAASPVRTTVVRFSNVYGSTSDHADRVVPAFARGALAGRPLRVDGRDQVFDFTHVSDVVRGLVATIARVHRGEPVPTVQFVTGVPTTLGALATLAVALAGTEAPVEEAPTRDYDVARFWGDPTRAREVLGWEATIDVRTGLARLIDDLRRAPSA